jgi:hypothetical protein
MLRRSTPGCLALLLVLPCLSQSLPKPRLPTNLPAAVPGADKIRSIPQTPGQAVREVKQEEVSQLMAKALASKDPEEQARLYTEILLLDPNNTVAYQGREKALEKVEKQKADEIERKAKTAQHVEESLGKEKTRRESLKKAEDAFLAGKVEAADRYLAPGKKVAPEDPDIQNLDALIQRELGSQKRKMWFLIGGGIALGLVAIVLLILYLRVRDPYIEIVSGEGKGKRYAIDKDLICIGAVAQDGAGKNDIVVRDVERMISRFHCEIHRRGRKVFLIDCESANGTWVDRRPAPPNKALRIKNGAHIDLAGTCTLRLGFERRKKK